MEKAPDCFRVPALCLAGLRQVSEPGRTMAICPGLRPNFPELSTGEFAAAKGGGPENACGPGLRP